MKSVQIYEALAWGLGSRHIICLHILLKHQSLKLTCVVVINGIEPSNGEKVS
jgi:hypothetical protein